MLVSEASVPQLERLLRAKRFGLLNALDEDLFERVCAHLPRHSRLNLFNACACLHSVKGSTVLQRMLSIDTTVEHAACLLNQLADAFFYRFPSVVEPGACIFADWTPYASKPDQPCCWITWSGVAPHMRVDMQEQVISDAVARAVDWDIGSVRITMHLILGTRARHFMYVDTFWSSGLGKYMSTLPTHVAILEVNRRRRFHQPSPFFATLARERARRARMRQSSVSDSAIRQSR